MVASSFNRSAASQVAQFPEQRYVYDAQNSHIYFLVKPQPHPNHMTTQKKAQLFQQRLEGIISMLRQLVGVLIVL